MYYVPLLCAWSYFPEKKTLVSGMILMCFSLNAILCSTITTNIVNPNNDDPDIQTKIGKNTEYFYALDSYQVLMVPTMFNRLALIALCFMALSLPLLTKKEKDPSTKAASKILDDAIEKLE